MKIITKGRHTIEMYSSIRETPIKRYIEYNKHLVTDSGVGSSMEDVMRHYGRLSTLLQSEKVKEAKQEVQNLQMNMYLMLEGISTSAMTFASLVKRVNKDLCEDITEEGLKRTLKLVGNTGITIEDISKTLEEVKKK